MNTDNSNIDLGEESKTIWVFTPSRTDPQDLEFILVQRQHLLQDAVERVNESAQTKHKHHLLFVGPRGSGKTHLVTLLVSRLTNMEKTDDHLHIAWLNEDETCTSLLELLIKIHAALEKRYPDEYKPEMLEQAYELKAEAALDFISQHLLATLGSRTLLVIVENLDAVFDGLQQEGQKQLRSFIQENPKFCIAATAQRLVEDLSSRSSPFFGFFQTEHLKPLSVKEATELLQNIAKLRKRDAVVEFLGTSRGHSRVRALHHLSGGNHRIYIVLSQFISRDSIDALIGPFMKMVDELTPYYQERLRWLPAQQRKIIEYLCSCEGTVSVKDIAKKLFASPQTISSQLQGLREKGYVEANQRGRESLYEVSEPLMRICVEVKENQSQQPLRLLVDFLRVWYDDTDLKDRLGKLVPASTSCAYLESALERNKNEGNLRKRLLAEDLQSSASACELIKEFDNPPEALLLAAECLADNREMEAIGHLNEAIEEMPDPASKARALLMRAKVHKKHGNSPSALADWTTVITLPQAPVEQVAMALFNRGVTYGKSGYTPRAIADYSAVITLPQAPVETIARALVNRGIAYGDLGDTQREIDDSSAVITLPQAPVETVARALVNRGIAYGKSGDTQREIADYSAVISLPQAPVDQVAWALVNRGVTYRQSGDTQRAIADYSAVITLPQALVEQVARALFNRGFTYGQLGDTQREIADYSAVITLPEAPVEQVAMALFNRGISYRPSGDTRREIADYSAVITLPQTPVELVARALVNRGIAYSQSGDTQQAIADYSAVITLPQAPVEQVAWALIGRGIAYTESGDTQRAIADYSAVITLPQAPVKPLAQALLGRSITYRQSGNTQQAIADYSAVITLPQAPADQVAMALYNRGVVQLKAVHNTEAQADFEAVICLPEAPMNLVADSYVSLSELYFIEGRWNEGFQALEAGLAVGAKAEPGYREDLTDIVAILFAAGLSPEGRREKVRLLVSACSKQGALAKLGEGVIQHLGRVFLAGEPFPSTDNLEGWAVAWEQATEDTPEFRLSMRLMRTGIDYVKAGGKDPGILLDLTSSERAILEQAFGPAEEDEK